MTSSTVAAILTVLGYSIYDTIIIFDRVRENIPLMRRASMRDDRERLAVGDDPPVAGHVVHHAAAGRLRCSSIGGATLKDFAFALMVGIASGAYSSIFIAAPLLCILKEREPEYARRKGEASDEARSSRKRWRSPRRSLRRSLLRRSHRLRQSDGPASGGLRPLRKREAAPAAPACPSAWTSPLGGSRSLSSARSR